MFRKAAEQGDAWAQYNLGWCYEHGRGVPQSYGEAVMWYRKVADQGNATAQNSLGLCYQNGYGVPQDKLQAYKWFTLASGHGNAEAAKERTSLTLQLSPAEIQKGEVMVREFVPKTTEENAG